MKNSSIATTTNNTSLTSKMSFADRLLMGEDIENIVDETTDELQPLETPTERAERGTVKRATIDLYKSLQDAGEVKRELWAQMAVDKGICKNVRQAANILRYDFLGIERVSLGTTIISKTSLSVEEAEQKALEMNSSASKEAERIIFEAQQKADKLINDTMHRATSLVERAKENQSRKAEIEAKQAAESVKKAGEVLKTLEKIDTSKVELTAEMREMMMKMLGLQTV